MQDEDLRAALRKLGPDDAPFVQDLLERLTGQSWRPVSEVVPSIAEIVAGLRISSLNDTMTGYYKGKEATVNYGVDGMRQIARKIQEQF